MVLTHRPKTTPKHIVIIRLSAMGDVAMTVPVVCALRNAYPELKITLLTRPFFHPFFRDIPDIEFLQFDPNGLHKGFLGLLRLAADIRSTGVDAVADLHDVLRTKIIRWSLFFRGIPFAHLFKDRRGRKQLTQRTGKVFEQITPIPEAYSKVFFRLGFRFPVECGPENEKRPMPEKITATTGKKRGVWIGIAPFAKHKGKIYPIDLTDKLIGILSERYRKVFIFGGGACEQAFADEMDNRYESVISLIGKVGLSEEMDVIGNLDAMIVMDSASMHIASLMGIPAISVWGATHPYAGFYGWGQDPADAVQLDLSCRPCSVYGNKPCIFGDYRCMRDIDPSMIADALERRLAAIKKARLKAARALRMAANAESENKPDATVSPEPEQSTIPATDNKISPEENVEPRPKRVRKPRSKPEVKATQNTELTLFPESEAEPRPKKTRKSPKTE